MHAGEDELVVQQHDHGKPPRRIRKEALQAADQAAQQGERQGRRDGDVKTAGAGAGAQRPRLQQLLPPSALPSAAVALVYS